MVIIVALQGLQLPGAARFSFFVSRRRFKTLPENSFGGLAILAQDTIPEQETGIYFYARNCRFVASQQRKKHHLIGVPRSRARYRGRINVREIWKTGRCPSQSLFF
jgi:hypothetical protein